MYKNATYKEKFLNLQEWLPSIFETIKKDIRNHATQDIPFAKKFLGSTAIQKLPKEEIVRGYQKAIIEDEKGEALGEFIASRWLLKNGDMYELFEKELNQIDTNFTELEQLEDQQAEILLKTVSTDFDPSAIYIFSVLNSVVFSKEIFDRLRSQAQEHRKAAQEEAESQMQQLAGENMQKTYEREIARLTDKYEKKLSGLEKKYIHDTDVLKKQMAHLQRKLQEKNCS